MVLLASALATTKYYLESKTGQQKITAKLSEALGREVSLRQPLTVRLWPVPTVTLHGLRVANAAWAEAHDFLQVQTLTIAPVLASLFELRLVLALRDAENGQMNLAFGSKGQGNWPKPRSGQDETRQWVRMQGWNNARAKNIEINLPGGHENRLHLHQLETSPTSPGRVTFVVNAELHEQPLNGKFSLPSLQTLLSDRASLVADIKTLAWDERDVAGTLTLHRDPNQKHHLTGDLHSKLWVAKGVADDTETSTSAAARDPITLPELSIPTAWQKLGNVDIRWHLDTLRAGLASATAITVRVYSEGDSLTIDPLNFRIDDAVANTRLTIDVPQQTPSVAYAGRIDHLDISERISAFTGQGEDRGILTTVFDFYGTGDDTRTALLNLNGDLRLVLEQGQFSTALLNRIAIDLGRLMGLASKVEGATPVRCLAVQARAENGVITIERLLMDTATLVLTGQGTINLRSSEIEVSINPSSEGLSLTQLQAPIDIHGDLSSPKSKLDLSAFAAEAASTIVPDFLREQGPIADLLGPAGDEGKGCMATLREYQSS